MKNLKALALIAAMAILLSACSILPGGSSKSIYDHGLDVITTMETMAESDEFFSVFSGDEEVKSVLAPVKEGDFTKPKAVYQIRIAGIMERDEYRALPDTLQTYLAGKAQATIGTQINALGGAKVLAASSICTAGKTFVSSGLKESVSYLYIYENALPVVVTFITGEDNTVSANGWFIFTEDFHPASIDEVQEIFAELGAVVSEVEIK